MTAPLKRSSRCSLDFDSAATTAWTQVKRKKNEAATSAPAAKKKRPAEKTDEKVATATTAALCPPASTHGRSWEQARAKIGPKSKTLFDCLAAIFTDKDAPQALNADLCNIVVRFAADNRLKRLKEAVREAEVSGEFRKAALLCGIRHRTLPQTVMAEVLLTLRKAGKDAERLFEDNIDAFLAQICKTDFVGQEAESSEKFWNSLPQKPDESDTLHVWGLVFIRDFVTKEKAALKQDDSTRLTNS